MGKVERNGRREKRKGIGIEKVEWNRVIERERAGVVVLPHHLLGISPLAPDMWPAHGVPIGLSRDSDEDSAREARRVVWNTIARCVRCKVHTVKYTRRQCKP